MPIKPSVHIEISDEEMYNDIVENIRRAIIGIFSEDNPDIAEIKSRIVDITAKALSSGSNEQKFIQQSFQSCVTEVLFNYKMKNDKSFENFVSSAFGGEKKHTWQSKDDKLAVYVDYSLEKIIREKVNQEFDKIKNALFNEQSKVNNAIRTATQAK